MSEGEKLVRLSVDVPRSQHRFLRVEAAQAGTTGMAVVRALISEMETNEDLAEADEVPQSIRPLVDEADEIYVVAPALTRGCNG